MPPMKQRPGGGRGGEFETPSSHLWVGNLPPDISESYLTDLFGKHGLLDGITSYPSRGYSFVYYKRVEDATAAKDALQGFMIRGNPLKIQFAKLAKPSKHVWVGGFSSSVTKEKLEEELSKFGTIEEFKFVRERNTALVDFVRLEDATAAVKNLNGFQIGGDRIRVDFLRSHPVRREQPDFPDLGSAQFRGMGAVDLSWNNPDAMRSYPEPPYSGHKRPQTPQSVGGRKENPPSKVLWVGYPASVVIDEEMLHNAMILYGEIERVTCFRGRHYSFVEFRSVEEARRAKEALQGRLFNDPRITIMYSNSDQAPGKDFGPPCPGFGGQRPDMFANEFPFRPPMMDMFPPNRGMAPNSFHGPLPPNAMLGPGVPRPLGPRGSFDPLLSPSDLNDPTTHSSMPDLAANASLRFNRRKLSPPAPGLLPTPGRTSHKTTGWDVVDPNQPPRALKRSRVDGQTSYPSPTIGKVDEYVAGVDQPYSSGPPQAIGGPLPRVHADSKLSPTPDMRVAKGHVARSNEDCVWRGVIAKGGTPVCNARCIAIGKGLECELPEAVNCSARTGLDMLTKHYASAIGFDIVFFLPDSEEDFANYTEFLRYLGSKNRAGVAKLDDGTTLFLVPPSDFLADVLKVPGRERLYGVVLKLPQQVPGDQPLPPPVAQMDRQLVPPTHEYVAPRTEQVPVQMDYLRATPNETLPPKGPFPTGSLSQEQSANNGVSSTSLPGVTLTPELIATLASLLPRNAQAPAPQTSQPQLNSSSTGFSLPVFPTNEKPAFSQGWNSQQQPQVVDQTGQQSHQQFNSQMYPHPQMSTISQPFPSNLNANMPMQNSVHNNQATPHSQQFVPSSQPYHFEPPHNAQKGYGMVYGDTQQPNNSGQYTFHGANLSLPENVLPSSSGTMKVEPQNQAERSQPVPSGAGQSTEVEVVKNQRYQTTLQFAADLLLQIQQRQQQQQASSHMGNQQ